MLKLKVKDGERVFIGKDITIRIHGKRTGLAIEAPRDLSIEREAVRQKREQEEKQ